VCSPAAADSYVPPTPATPKDPRREPGVAALQKSRGPDTTSLRELAALFLRLGATTFRGPAAHIAMLQDEIVRRRA
jgi:chromate transporter